MKPKTIIGLIVVCIALAVILSACQPECGNRVVEEGENASTCCLDAGCIGDESCTNNTCIAPECRECQYVEAGKCINYECCDDDECGATEKCDDHKCEKLLCGACQYIEDSECKDLECCDDDDCDDQNDVTMDLCKFPGTQSSECTNEAIETCNDNEDCDDDDDSTEDLCITGNPNECIHMEITECKNGDGACPDDCDWEDDDDCDKNIIECNHDVDCFKDALDDCEPADMTLDMNADNDSVEMDVIVYVEILGWNSHDNCDVEFTLDTWDIYFTDDYYDELMDDPYNMTEDDVDNLEDDANYDADDLKGESTECEITDNEIDDLQDVLDDWDGDDYDIDDMHQFDCNGDYFD